MDGPRTGWPSTEFCGAALVGAGSNTLVHDSVAAVAIVAAVALPVPCSSEEAQVLHVAGLANRQVTLTIQGDEVTIAEVVGSAAANAAEAASYAQQQSNTQVCTCSGHVIALCCLWLLAHGAAMLAA
jgi:hypothetical protein